MEVKMTTDPMDDGMWRITIFATSESEVRQHLAMPEIMEALKELKEARSEWHASCVKRKRAGLDKDYNDARRLTIATNFLLDLYNERLK
jgi:hypothetical protein